MDILCRYISKYTCDSFFLYSNLSLTKFSLLCLQGGVKAALSRIRETCSSRERELKEEVLVLQERLDSLSDSLTERTEENATLNTQV